MCIRELGEFSDPLAYHPQLGVMVGLGPIILVVSIVKRCPSRGWSACADHDDVEKLRVRAMAQLQPYHLPRHLDDLQRIDDPGIDTGEDAKSLLGHVCHVG